MNCDFPLTQATTALGMTDGQVALLVRELAFPPGKTTAELKEMFINDLAAAKIITVPEQVAVGLPHPKDKKGRYSMKLVGQVQHDADDQIKKLLQDPPMSRSTLILMPTHGIILNQNGGPNRAKVNVLPFGGACFKEKLIVRGAILPADYYNIQRLMLIQNKVVAPLVVESCRLLYEAESTYQSKLDAEANNRDTPNEIRQNSLKKALKSRSKLHTIKEIAAEPHKYFVAAVRELDVFHVLDALDETINPIPRDDKDPIARTRRFKIAGRFSDFSGYMAILIVDEYVGGTIRAILNEVKKGMLKLSPPDDIKLLRGKCTLQEPKIVAHSTDDVRFVTSQLIRHKIHMIAADSMATGGAAYAFDELASGDLSPKQ